MKRAHLTFSLLGMALLGCTGEIGDALPPGAELLDALPGDAVAVDGIEVIAPFEGEGVFAEIVFEDGSTGTLQIQTLLDGRVIVLAPPEEQPEEEGEPIAEGEAAGEATASSAPGPCSDRAYNLFGFRWTETYRWRFNAGSTPGYMNVDAVETRLRRAATNITRSDNSCSMADLVSARHAYEGRTSRGVQIGAGGGCKSSNGHNTVAFGDLPAGVLGVACVWSIGNEAVEGDIKLNKADHKWVASIGSACQSRWSVEGVTTHEMGHVFGLAHVGEAAHGNLTMSTHINGPCQNSEATLGRGDVRALRQKY